MPSNEKRFDGTIRYIYAQWPRFLFLYVGIIVALVSIGVSAQRGWLAFVPQATAVLLLFAYFLAASLWTAHQLYDRGGIRPHHALFDLGNIQSDDTFVYIDLGLRHQAIGLSRRLTTGKIIVIDIYNPQLTTNRALVRGRSWMLHPPSDPRLNWREGGIDLLPLPDQSVTAVLLCQIASEFWQHGDRAQLLWEIGRILTPNGQLLLAERVRTQTNWLFMGLSAWQLETADYWRHLLANTGFRIRKEKDYGGLIRCFQAAKPTPTEAQQLTFDLLDK